MTAFDPADEALGKALFDKCNRGWPEPKLKWEDLPKGTQYLWIQRAKKGEKQ